MSVARNLLFFLAISAAYGTDLKIPAHYLKDEYRIPMRDGVRLFTIAYIPKDTREKYPILLTRTPYGIAPYEEGKFPDVLGPSEGFTKEGFIFVYQDARGRYMSEGEFVDDRPIQNSHKSRKNVDESTDAYDTIDWLVRNVPNNNGRVGIVGISYNGFYSAAALVDAHPALVAVSPQAPMANLYMGDDAFHNGAFFLAANFDFFTEFRKERNPRLPGAEPDFQYGTKSGYDFFLRLGPLQNANKRYFHNKNSYWTPTVEHTTYDRFWQSRNILPHLTSVRPAVLVVGGWYDAEDLAGTLGVFRAVDQQSPQTQVQLVMGPWRHGGWEGAKEDRLGDISFGSDTSQFFQDEIALPFFCHYLKDAPDPQLPKAYVFETGKNEWKKEMEWPPSNAQLRTLYLGAARHLLWNADRTQDGFDQYVSDPSNPIPYFSKPSVGMAPEYMDGDQRFADHRPDVLSFQTEPLKNDLVIAGPIIPTLYVSTTGTDSDFDLKIIDIYPDDAPGLLAGYEQLVRGEPFRGKFRDSFESPQPFRPGSVQKIHFTMPDVYHCFQKGHRLMIQVQSSWFPLTDRNPQQFLDIPNAKPGQFQRAIERIYREASAASAVEFYVLP